MKPFLQRKEENMAGDKCLGTYCGYGMREELYQNENGEFVLLGKGNPSTKYAVHCCGNLIAGSKITPLSYEAAQEWCKEKLSEQEYERVFLREDTDGGKTE